MRLRTIVSIRGVMVSLASAAGEVGPKAEANIRWKQEENRIGRRGGVRMRRKSSHKSLQASSQLTHLASLTYYY